MHKCPKCRRPDQKVPGYIIRDDKIIRCDVCNGWGFTTTIAIMAWELSL